MTGRHPNRGDEQEKTSKEAFIKKGVKFFRGERAGGTQNTFGRDGVQGAIDAVQRERMGSNDVSKRAIWPKLGFGRD